MIKQMIQQTTRLTLLGFILLLVLPCAVTGQWIEPKDLSGSYVDGEPFDVVFLTEDAEDAILKIKPLGSNLPQTPLPDRGKLVFQYFSGGDDEKFQVPFSSIKEIKTFHQLVIEEADQWLDEKEYAKALRNLLYVYDRGGKDDPQLVSTLKNCMFLDGKANFENAEFELALSIYEDIFERDPDFRVPGLPPLDEIVMACHNGIIQKRFDRGDYVGVRQSLDSVVAKHGKLADQLKNNWTQAFNDRSDGLLERADQLASEGRGREAHLAAKQADQMTPGRPIVLATQKQLLTQFPLIVVGVSQTAANAQPDRNEHWGARRIGRLTQRTLLENTGLTDEGGKFEFLNGVMYRQDDAGLKYALEIKEEVSDSAVPPVDAFQISMRLLAMADPDSPSYNASWAKIVESVAIEDENLVSFTLRTPFVRPEALLKLTYLEPDEDGQPVQNGSYVITDRNKDITTFEVNPSYQRRSDRQNPVLVEQVFDSESTAVDQLIAGNIDVVDRVPPADVARLKANRQVEVRSYILPTVHMLIPKIRGELATAGNFRNGLSHGIDRGLLIDEVICGGQPISGCETISGPFPIGTEENDQIGYGYDLKVRPLPFDSQLGMVLVNLSLRADPPVRPTALPSPDLVIAHPNSSTAANASAAIARMWAEIGVETTTRELKEGETMPSDDEWDFVYLEVSMEEPLSDAFDMIGPNGFANNVSAPVEQTLRNLSYARSWQAACASLRRLHRQTSVDLSIIPLWQVKEHYAYRNTVRGIGRDLIHLYQNVDRWKIDLTVEEEPQE